MPALRRTRGIPVGADPRYYFLDFLKRALAREGYCQATLAEDLHIAQSILHQIATGRRKYYSRRARVIAWVNAAYEMRGWPVPVRLRQQFQEARAIMVASMAAA
jgi:hypothetical protein